MNEPLEAAWEVSQFLRANGISHVLIGGLAVSRWGQVRFTADEALENEDVVERFERAAKGSA